MGSGKLGMSPPARCVIVEEGLCNGIHYVPEYKVIPFFSQ